MSFDYYSQKRFLILNVINHLGPISRTELIELTDYRPASVGAIIKELLDEGLIIESGRSASGHGRKRVLLSINHKRICSIVISVLYHEITFLFTQSDGSILHQMTMALPNGQTPSMIIDKIEDTIKQLLTRFADRIICGIGICEIPYDPTHYRTDSTLLSGYNDYNGWIHTELKPRLEKLTNMTVNIYGSGTLPVLAERRYGMARNEENFFCVQLDNGIGTSICCNGRPVAGADGAAGELGHTVIDLSSNQQLCYCGKPGCLESGTAWPALAADIQAALTKGVFSSLNSYHDRNESITVDDVRRALDEGDQLCIYYVKNAAVRMGVGIANMINILNPRIVVLSGFMLGLGPFFLDHLEASIRENVVVVARNYEIRVSPSAERILPLGAAAEVYSDFIRMADYRWVYQLQSTTSESE
ncbi:MAG: ROK family transcriptional regulator [Clostridia bacterium]|nr:ROK family transcriptional regulator [Clostridia bacterium]